MKFAPPGAPLFHRTLVALDRCAGPDVAARADGELKLKLPADWRDADVLFLTAIDSQQRELWTWSWRWKSGATAIGTAQDSQNQVTLAQNAAEIVATSGRNTVRFSPSTGRLVTLERDGRAISFANGPRLVAYRRAERVLQPVAPVAGKLLNLQARMEGASAVVTAVYDAGIRSARWTISPNGDVRLDYEFDGPGLVDILGVDFDYPEEKMKSKEWFGAGPYRVWANRLKGGSLWRWDTEYNDNIPGVTWQFPEFKGWFSRWDWMAFTTTEGRFALLNDGRAPFVGVYSPRDGKNKPVLTLPRLGLGVYHVIPAIGTKGSLPSNLGPQGQPQNVTGIVKGSLVIRMLDQP